jgi:hypothetical protein
MRIISRRRMELKKKIKLFFIFLYTLFSEASLHRFCDDLVVEEIM